jgi:CDGSH-type Zn-finger protein/truncated hemoglobin YjbI
VPAIEVTKDGPYRITGGIPLLDAAGGPVGRNVGSSREHYALCRCGHSQNKPFCSGMHWYVEFRDPVPAAGHEPTPFEWAGGLPALTRAARLLYERHVPADPLLAAAFANMPPEQPQRLAGWLGEALGGPTSDYADDLRTTVGWADDDVGESHRARWVALLAVAADEALLPADPAFRAVLSGCAEWLSRTAEVPGEQAAVRPTPRWDWGPGGPPPPPAPVPTPEDAPQPAEDVSLRAQGEPIGFEVHLRPLFRERDRHAMRFAFDLWSADDVRAHAADVLDRVQEGSMPCDVAWPPERVDVFRRWIVTGMQP